MKYRDKQYSIDQLRNKILYYINYRPRSSKEVLQKLATLNATEEQTTQIIAELRHVQLINDEKLLPLFVREYLEIKKLSISRTKLELQRKGFAPELITDCLQEYRDEENYSEEDQAATLLRQKYSFLIDEQKMIGFLARKGFSFSIAQKAISRFKDTFFEDDI